MNQDRVTFLLVDDHAVLRVGLRTLLETVPGFEVIAEAGSRAAALAEARRGRPDVVIMDVRLPDGSGAEACREIRSERPETQVLILTSYADEEAILACIIAGAAGYLLKESDPETLIEAARLVARGKSLLDPAVTQTVLQWVRRQGPAGSVGGPLAGLTAQERKIVPLIAKGKTNREIAAELYFSEHTVKAYISNILRKLHLHRRVEVASLLSRYAPSAGRLAHTEAGQPETGWLTGS